MEDMGNGKGCQCDEGHEIRRDGLSWEHAVGSPPRPRARDSLLEEMTRRSLECGPEGVGSAPLHCKCMTEWVSM